MWNASMEFLNDTILTVWDQHSSAILVSAGLQRIAEPKLDEA